MLKETKIALFISLCVGLIYLFPHIIYALEDGPYNPLYVTPGRAFLDEAIYAAGVQEVLEGTIVPTDLMVIDNKNGSFIYGPFPFIVIALLSLSGGIVGAIIISDFLFAAFGFFLFYLLAKKIVQSHRLALIGAILFVFFYRLFIPPPSFSISGIISHLTSSFWNGTGAPVHFWLSRFIHPQIPILLLLGTILTLYCALEKNNWKYYFLTAILFTLSFYSYFYNWTYLLVFMGILALFALIQKKKEWFQRIITTTILSLILAIPYFINALALQTLDITQRSGI